jgi:hypothetical protein
VRLEAGTTQKYISTVLHCNNNHIKKRQKKIIMHTQAGTGVVVLSDFRGEIFF